MEKLTSLTSRDIKVKELNPKRTKLIDDYTIDAVKVGKDTIDTIKAFLKTTLKLD